MLHPRFEDRNDDRLGAGPASTGKLRGEPLAISRTAAGGDGAGEAGALEVEVQRDAGHRGAQVGPLRPPGVGRAPRGRATGAVLVPRAGQVVEPEPRRAALTARRDPTVARLPPCGLR